jgi:hypothetical protein
MRAIEEAQAMNKIKLYREAYDDEGHTLLTDGVHWYFDCSWTSRVRWSLRDFPDDGIGVRTNGAAKDLRLAVMDAHRMLKIRNECS